MDFKSNYWIYVFDCLISTFKLKPLYIGSIISDVIFYYFLEWVIEDKAFTITLNDASSNYVVVRNLKFNLNNVVSFILNESFSIFIVVHISI